MTLQRWFKAWQALGAEPTPSLAAVHERLLAAYAEPQRHYHTGQHLAECFAQLDALAPLARSPAEVEVALWFHDAVYQPRKSDNEARSADWARETAQASGIAPDSADRIQALILATRHAALPQGPDQEVLVDVDLSILGANPARFDEYEEQVRAEYAWVPGFLYRRKRGEILEEFLARPAIYSTTPCRERLEPAARANLARSLARLGG